MFLITTLTYDVTDSDQVIICSMLFNALKISRTENKMAHFYDAN